MLIKIRSTRECKKIIGYDANALYLWAIAQEMPTGKHEHIKTYDLKQLEQDILNDKLFGFIQVDIETPENLKEHFAEMTPIFKNAEIKFDDIGEYMKNYHTENNIPFNAVPLNNIISRSNNIGAIIILPCTWTVYITRRYVF